MNNWFSKSINTSWHYIELVAFELPYIIFFWFLWEKNNSRTVSCRVFGWSFFLLTTTTVFHLKDKKKKKKKMTTEKRQKTRREIEQIFATKVKSQLEALARAHTQFTKLWSNRIVLHFDCSYCRERSVCFVCKHYAAQVDAVRLCVCPIEMYSTLFLYFDFIGISVTFSISPRRSIHVSYFLSFFTNFLESITFFFLHSLRSCRFVVAINAYRRCGFLLSHSSFSLADDQVSNTKDMDALFIYLNKRMRSYQIFFP